MMIWYAGPDLILGLERRNAASQFDLLRDLEMHTGVCHHVAALEDLSVLGLGLENG